MIRELHDEDAVAGDQADERDQPDLAVDVDGRQAEEREEERARERQRHRAGQDDERVAEALELRGEHEVDQDRGQQEHAEEAGSLGAELAGLAGVIDREAARQGLRLVFDELQRGVERDTGRVGALDADGVELLEALQLARLRRGGERGKGRKRNELPTAACDVDLRQLIGCQPVAATDERNDLVAPPLDAEAVHVVSAEQRREVASGLGQIDALRAEFVAVEDHAGLGLIELQVGVGKHELAALHGLLHDGVGELGELRRLGGRDDRHIDRQSLIAGQ